MRYGSLCSGIGGLDIAVEQTFGVTPAWFCEADSHAASVLHRWWPDVPVLPDLKTQDWTNVEPVELVCAGYPCQPFSMAGRRQGADDPRHLWPYVIDAVRVLRPRLVVLENVAGHLGLGFDAVLCDLAEAGFDAEWTVVRASDAGAPHRRERLFVVAHAERSDRRSTAGVSGTTGEHMGSPGRLEGAASPTGDRPPPPHAIGGQLQRRRGPRELGTPASGAASEAQQRERDGDTVVDRCAASADTQGQQQREPLVGVGQRPEPVGGRPSPAHTAGDACRLGNGDCESSTDTPGEGLERATRPLVSGGVVGPAWGDYEPAIRRWAHVLGRPAPQPTDEKGRLSVPFVEWMQGFPEGWVDDLSRTAALRCLGNAVVQQQGALALSMLKGAA